MLKTGGILTLSKGSWRNLQCLWWPLHGIPSGTPLKNNTTLLKATRTSTPDGPPYVKKGTRQYQISPIFSIPYAPNWVSKTLSVIWCSNTVVVFIDTFKHKWSSWTSPLWARLIDTLSRSSRNLSRKWREFGSANPSQPKQGKGNPNPHSKGPSQDGHPQDNQSKPTQRRAMRRRRRTRENGVSTIKVLGTTPKNVTPSSPSWSS
jgi:hypothetical protein